ncbi:redox-sensing transcriptional repressor Rex [Parafrankia sp. EUN1f]|uniref:redox-sensing transcriptional repressor Rex n=1 Tax=Parafrankia sp. EUN1f TaxID=102897 RepID=UPI0001C4673C|nr:redox-sensing transcriptional repressor Rex [Parafrankia sp. EUN1f]EFC82685.1 CoA-binding domain protein [Parafrankia sp. EUN1f]
MGSPRRGTGRLAGRSPMPEATVARLPLYLRVLTGLGERGVETVSSDTLAAAAGVTSAKVRKDLSQLGSFGTRGVGYEVGILLECISAELGLTEDRSVVLVGVGNLGHALAGYGGFHARGFRIAALVDADPSRVGERVGAVVVRPADELEAVIEDCQVTIGVICTPVAAAQGVCDRLVAAGVTSILNFAPTVLSVPEGVDVRKVDLALELQILSFHEARKRPSPGLPPRPGVRAVGGEPGPGGIVDDEAGEVVGMTRRVLSPPSRVAPEQAAQPSQVTQPSPVTQSSQVTQPTQAAQATPAARPSRVSLPVVAGGSEAE